MSPSERPTRFGQIHPPDEAWLTTQPPEPILEPDRLAASDYRTEPKPPTSTELAARWRQYMETCIELFGAGRYLFESNFPVDKMGIGWAGLWNALERIASGASATEKQAMFSGTARRVNRLDGSPAGRSA